MIDLVCSYINASRMLSGDLTITLAIKDESLLNQLEELKGKPLSITIDKYSEQRSKQANRYFWKLCGKVARALGMTKQEVHDIAIRKNGVFFDLTIPKEQKEELLRRVNGLDLVDERYENLDGTIEARAVYGTRTYTRKEMAIVMDELVNWANDLGVNTLPQEQIDAYIAEWEGI